MVVARQIAAKDTTPILVLGNSASPSSHTGDIIETTLATINVPASAMKLNGLLRITAIFTLTGSNAKNLRFKLGATTLFLLAPTTDLTPQTELEVWNRNSASSQFAAFKSTRTTDLVLSGVAHATAAVDTSQAQTFTITGQLVTTSEVITLEAATVELVGSPLDP